MEKLIVAIATDDGKNFTKSHFGEAKKYCIYEISNNNIKLIATVENSSEEERMHADPQKANGVAVLLKPYNVNVLINSVFGGNINIMKQKFVCILAIADEIETQLQIVKLNFKQISDEWEKGITRNFLKL